MKYILICLATITLIALSSCSNNRDTTPTGQTVIYADSSQFSGRLIVEVYDTQNRRVNQALVGLYLNRADITDNLALLWLNTQSNGRADFGFVNLGNYYIKAEVANTEQVLSAIGACQVRSQQTTVYSITVR